MNKVAAILKHFVILALSLLYINGFAQNENFQIEQSAIDFLAKEIYPQEKRVSRFYYDGKIEVSYPDSSSIKFYIYDFAGCKSEIDRDKEANGYPTSGRDWYNEAKMLAEKVTYFEVDTSVYTTDVRLSIPRKIRKVKNIKGYKFSRFRRWASRLTGSKHYITVFNAIKVADLYFVKIDTHVTYDDLGFYYMILVNEEGKVIDWCKTTWIS